MKSIVIDIVRGTGDCEDCGGYGWAHGTVSAEGMAPLVLVRDGHLGGGNWNGSSAEAFYWALQCIGVQIVTNHEDNDFADTYYDIDRSAGYRELINRKLGPESSKSLRMFVIEHPDYEMPTKVVVPAQDILRHEIIFETDYNEYGESTTEQWDGDFASVLKAVLEQLCHLEFNETYQS